MTRTEAKKELLHSVFGVVKVNFECINGEYICIKKSGIGDKNCFSPTHYRSISTLLKKAYRDEFKYGYSMTFRRILLNTIDFLESKEVPVRNSLLCYHCYRNSTHEKIPLQCSQYNTNGCSISNSLFCNRYGNVILGTLFYKNAIEKILNAVYECDIDETPDADDIVDDRMNDTLSEIRKTFTENSLEHLMTKAEEDYLRKYRINNANNPSISIIPSAVNLDFSIVIPYCKSRFQEDKACIIKYAFKESSPNVSTYFYISQFLYPGINDIDDRYAKYSASQEVINILYQEKKDFGDYCSYLFSSIISFFKWTLSIKWDKLITDEPLSPDLIKSIMNITEVSSGKKNALIANIQEVQKYLSANGMKETKIAEIIVLSVCILIYNFCRSIDVLCSSESLSLYKTDMKMFSYSSNDSDSDPAEFFEQIFQQAEKVGYDNIYQSISAKNKAADNRTLFQTNHPIDIMLPYIRSKADGYISILQTIYKSKISDSNILFFNEHKEYFQKLFSSETAREIIVLNSCSLAINVSNNDTLNLYQELKDSILKLCKALKQ